MIAEAFLNVWYSFLGWLFGLIPEFSLPSDILGTLYHSLRYIQMVNEWIPVGELFVLVPIVIGFWVICGVVSAVLQLL